MYTSQDGDREIRVGVGGELPPLLVTHPFVAMSWFVIAARRCEDDEHTARLVGRAWGYMYRALLEAYDAGTRRS